MIPRYTREKMGALWSEEHKYQTWLTVEILACEAWAELGEIPREAVQQITERAQIDPHRIEEIERETKHDVAAFVAHLEETVGEAGKYVHYGLTSYDIVDTALSLRLREAAEIIIEDIDNLMEAIRENAFEHQETIMIGRTHGVHAEPITFGLKMALWYEEMRRHRARMEQAKAIISVGKLSGAVGTFANAPPSVEEYVCKKLGLKPAAVSSQIIQRDRHAEFFTALALLASSIEKFAVEIRHLQRTEVLEAEEPFVKGQKGSSSMPHKRNPMVSEAVVCLTRIIRQTVPLALEVMAQEHEGEMTTWQAEWEFIPRVCILTAAALRQTTYVMGGLRIHADAMKRNLDALKGLMMSEAVMMTLAKQVGRQEAHEITYQISMAAFEKGISFREALLANPTVAERLTETDVDNLLEPRNYLGLAHYFVDVVCAQTRRDRAAEGYLP